MALRASSGLWAAYPETEKHLNGLAEALLRAPSSLTSGERETIAAYVSAGNECRFCCQSHAAAARAHLGEQRILVDQVLADAASAPVSPKMKALLAIADKVRRDGRLVKSNRECDSPSMAMPNSTSARYEASGGRRNDDTGMRRVDWKQSGSPGGRSNLWMTTPKSSPLYLPRSIVRAVRRVMLARLD
jgi:AhpD family alkylhydroperoxidase